MRATIRLFAAMTLFSLCALASAHADGPRGSRPPGRPPGFNNGFRPDFRRPGDFRDDFFRRRNNNRFCWCGFDFDRNRGHNHRHDRFDRFPTFPFPFGGQF
jgi:hypothetical protein